MTTAHELFVRLRERMLSNSCLKSGDNDDDADVEILTSSCQEPRNFVESAVHPCRGIVRSAKHDTTFQNHEQTSEPNIGWLT